MKNKLLSMFFLLAIVPAISFAHGFGWDEGWMPGWGSHHMGFMGGGWMMIIWLVLLGFIIVSGVKWIFQRNNSSASSNALAILSERYAKGEISQDEFETMKKSLR